jgi:hypothetical protein
MSHVKNMQAFEKLTGLCTGYGGSYNPGQQNLQVDALIAKLNNAQQVLMEVTEAQTVYDSATNSREGLFNQLKKLSSRILSVLKGSGADALTLKDARACTRKLWGYRSSKPPDPVKEGEAVPKSPSVYGTDFASAVYHFAKLVETVSAAPSYQPNEPELQVEALRQMLNTLQSANERVVLAEVQRVMARKKRNDLFYENENCLYATLKAIKSYVRGALGFLSTEHIQITRLRFTKPMA